MEEFLTYQLIVWIWPILGTMGLGLLAYFARRFVRAHEATFLPPSDVKELLQRIESLEEALEASQADIARVSAAQDFTTRLLADRVPTAP